MLKRTLKTKAVRIFLPLALAAIFGYGSIKVFGDRYPPFMGCVCLGLFMGLILGGIIRDWE
jgi:hypothetical protein